MGTKAFLAAVSEIFHSVAPPHLGPYGERQSFSFVQFHLGVPSIHYEVWVQKRQRQVEVGLHFEAGRELNLELLDRVAAHGDTLRGALGPEIEMHRWTPVWTRVHETLRAPALDLELAEVAAVRVAQFIEATHDLIADVARGDDLARTPRPEGRFERRRARVRAKGRPA
jgi:hypothetical protein